MRHELSMPIFKIVGDSFFNQFRTHLIPNMYIFFYDKETRSPVVWFYQDQSTERLSEACWTTFSQLV